MPSRSPTSSFAKVWARIAARPTQLDIDISSLDRTKLRKPLSECRQVALAEGILRSAVHQRTDVSHSIRLLRPCHYRPPRSFSLDPLVGGGQQCFRDGEAEGFGGLGV